MPGPFRTLGDAAAAAAAAAAVVHKSLHLENFFVKYGEGTPPVTKVSIDLTRSPAGKPGAPHKGGERKGEARKRNFHSRYAKPKFAGGFVVTFWRFRNLFPRLPLTLSPRRKRRAKTPYLGVMARNFVPR
jgi:hypothetical protein